MRKGNRVVPRIVYVRVSGMCEEAELQRHEHYFNHLHYELVRKTSLGFPFFYRVHEEKLKLAPKPLLHLCSVGILQHWRLDNSLVIRLVLCFHRNITVATGALARHVRSDRPHCIIDLYALESVNTTGTGYGAFFLITVQDSGRANTHCWLGRLRG
uniref:Uncharacterized protein n=1 Tax=Anopheles atroparvus TaxID=41427 RepID=A0AAG5DJH9_ANOAO